MKSFQISNTEPLTRSPHALSNVEPSGGLSLLSEFSIKFATVSYVFKCVFNLNYIKRYSSYKK